MDDNSNRRIEFKEITTEAAFNEALRSQEGIYHLFVLVQSVTESYNALRESHLTLLAAFGALHDLLVEKKIVTRDDLAKRVPRFQAQIDQAMAAISELSGIDDDDVDE